MRKVILDTDLGMDFDDSWAMAILLKSPEIDLKLITTVSGDTNYRAKICAKYLTLANRTDIPIATGDQQKGKWYTTQRDWIKQFNISQYPGSIYDNGVEKLIETILNAEGKITIIAIGPLTNIAAAINKEPKIVEKVEFIGMQGSIYRGYEGVSQSSAEYNIIADLPAAQQVFQADWNMTITPLDTCGIVTLSGDYLRTLKNAQDPIVNTLLDTYHFWLEHGDPGKRKVSKGKTPVLFDTVAAYLALSEKYLNIEELRIKINHKGLMIIDENGKNIRCATSWKDLNAYKEWLVNRLIS
ncbi:MAG: nucleoside hydrolase [Promethearchaeia archaeon]